MPIRRATEADTEAIRRVAERSWAVDYPGILTRETAESAVTDWYTADGLAAELAEDRTLLFVAERDGAVVGFVHGYWNESDGEGYILRLYVHPDHRRENRGRALLERVCRAFEERNCERINAMVLTENDPGNAFYDRFGFELAEERETTIGSETHPENRYVLAAPVEIDGT